MSGGRRYPDRPVIGVGAVIVVSEREGMAIDGGADVRPRSGVVLVRRRHEPLAGEWSLPGGALEVGETLEAGVAREVAEETGLAVDVGPVIEVFDRITLDDDQRVQYHYVLVDYLCRPIGGRLQPGSDSSDAIVADPADLDRFGLTPKAESVIRRGLSMAAGA